MKFRVVITLALAALLMSGCAGFSPLTISESTLERHLQDAVSNYDREQLQAGSPLSLSLSNADITLGPDGRDVAVIDLSGQVALNALMAKIPANINLKVEGSPVYDSQERAIYIRRLKLLESSVDTPYFGSKELAPVTDNVMRVVAQMLENVPVYRLDDTSLGARIMGMTDMDLRVAPGRLEFVKR
ncbi:DUF1439 domain-containing protein [Marinobacter zhanjiangensis]|uniref:Lipoprotein n=1 Tax=Marinobacter zhanjiangensis TaxID=578215 RepID=A0ABQ3B254_9GAMM|nr:DUF1439 domain-containing protein [Marinobacter zhanjiangensis]GGY76117.1 hypothetical protein GCM10007071_24390 [Marinobacter zhanjiangensis]